MTSISDLHDDIIILIFGHLSVGSLKMCEDVCIQWRQCSRNGWFWKQKIQKHYPKAIVTLEGGCVNDWVAYLAKELLRSLVENVFEVLDFRTPEQRFRSCFYIVTYNAMVEKVNTEIEKLNPEEPIFPYKLFMYPLNSKIQECAIKSEIDRLVGDDFSEVSVSLAESIVNDKNMYNVANYCKILLNSCCNIGHKIPIHVIATYFKID